MKRAITKNVLVAILAMIMFLNLTGCGSPYKDVEDKIAAIGTVTKESEEAIKEAREAYQALPENEQTKVANYELLEQAEEELNQIVVGEVETLIGKLKAFQVGIPEKEEMQLIEDARSAYNALTETQKKRVTNVEVLLNAEAAANSPYGIPLYSSAKDVELSKVFAGHGVKRIVDLFGGFLSTKHQTYVYLNDAKSNHSAETKEYYFLDISRWDEPQYVQYSETPGDHSRTVRIADSYSLLVFNADLYNGEPYIYSSSKEVPSFSNMHPLSAAATEAMLNAPFTPFAIGDNVEYHVTKAEEADGMYLIYFDYDTANKSDKGSAESGASGSNIAYSEQSGRYVLIDPETSLIRGYGVESYMEYNNGIQDVKQATTTVAEVDYGLEELPDYSFAWSKVFNKG